MTCPFNGKRQNRSCWTHKRVAHKDEYTFPPRPIKAKPAVIVCKLQQKQLFQSYYCIWFLTFVKARRSKVEMHTLIPKRPLIYFISLSSDRYWWKINIPSLSTNKIATTYSYCLGLCTCTKKVNCCSERNKQTNIHMINTELSAFIGANQ